MTTYTISLCQDTKSILFETLARTKSVSTHAEEHAASRNFQAAS